MPSPYAVTTLAVGLTVGPWLPAHAQVVDTPMSRALTFFATLTPADPDDTLRALRPPAASMQERARVLATLPENGALEPTVTDARKIAALEAILVYHDRQGVFAIKLIDVPQIVVGLYKRVVLLLSRSALQQLSESELQAMVAHEIGHDYFEADLERSLHANDLAVRQTLELKCDGIAVLTLVALRLKGSPLHEGARKMASFNERLGAIAGAEGYPSLGERRAFVKALLAVQAAHALTSRPLPASRPDPCHPNRTRCGRTGRQ